MIKYNEKQISKKAGDIVNLLHMKHAVEVAKSGSLNKAADKLLVAAPNISRSIKELESDLGITIFERGKNGMTLTPEGEEFMSFANEILGQIDRVERYYKDGSPHKRKFSISVPRACYISEAFSQFTKELGKEPCEIFYKETNSQRTIHNMVNHDYKLGIIRYAENYDKYFKAMLEEKGFGYEIISDFTYSLIMSSQNPLAQLEEIRYEDLRDYIEIAHADPYVPSMPTSKVVKEELPDTMDRRIFIFERASQFDLLHDNPETFMWVSPAPKALLERYDLVQKKCVDNKRVYKDVLIYKEGYKFSELDNLFITKLCESRRKYL